MSTKPSKVSTSSGVTALVVVIAVIMVGYTLYLEQYGKALEFQSQMLSPSSLIMKPSFVIELISRGGYLGTFTAVLLKALSSVVAVALAYTVVSLVLSALNRRGPESELGASQAQAETDVVRKQVFSASIPGSEMQILLPANKDQKTGEVIEGITDSNPYQQDFFRIDALPVKLAREPVSPVEHLQRDILELLEAHPEVPASVGNHHADATLRTHSVDVAKKTKAVMDRLGWCDPMTVLAGLGHDLDKLLAYKRKGNGWAKNKDATHHNTYSAYIVRNLPSFAGLDKDDQYVLTMVLRYYHHPEMLPLQTGDRVERLIQALREADGWGLRSEREKAISAAIDSPTTHVHLADGLTKFLADADINRKKGGTHADGWTVHAVEFVAVPASTILERLDKYIPIQLSQQLQLNVDTRLYGHPAIEVLKDTFQSMGLLMEQYKDFTSPTGLFDLKVGRNRFKATFLLRKAGLHELVPSAAAKWGMSDYGIRVTGPTKTGLDDQRDDVDEE